MKKLIILVVILVVAGGLYFWKSKTDTGHITQPEPTNNFTPDPSSATFTFDDGVVTLSNGRNESDDSGILEETRLLDEDANGDINADGKLDSVVLLARSGGGSGVFIYAAAYVSGPINYKGTNAVYLGDRISPQSISISSGVATVNFLDRYFDEAFAAEPTVPTYKEFIYKNGVFEER